jgi:starch synthase
MPRSLRHRLASVYLPPAVEILFVSTEVAPYSRRAVSGSADAAQVVAALPKALRGLGHKVTVLSPLYASINPQAHSLARRLSTLTVPVAGQDYVCTVLDGRTTGGVDLIFIGNAEVFGHAPDAAQASQEASDEQRALTSLLLSGAAAQLIQKREPAFDIVHAHGASAAFTLALLKAQRPTLPCALQIYDPEDTGELPASLATKLERPLGLSQSSLLGLGAAAADVLISSSFGTAQTLLTSPLSSPSALRSESPHVIGIVNGVDASIWNPVTDSQLVARFDPTNLAGKSRNKGALQFELGLAVQPELPLIVAIGELSKERGGDLIADIASRVLRNEAQLVVLGSPGAAATHLQKLAEEMPERFCLRQSHTEKERHTALAAADFLLLPARSPHDVDIALCALRYGALPIVRPVGALADSIIDVDAKLETGNGFLAETDSADEVLACVQRALSAYASTDEFNELRRRIMRTDTSWERAARRYEHAYKKQIRPGAAA